MDDNKFWLINNSVIVIAISIMCFTGKGCSQSEYEMIKHSLNLGCSKVLQPGGGYNLICPEKK